MANTILLREEAVSLPLPIFEMKELASLTSRDGEKFSIYIGANKEVVDQLRERSLDESDTEVQTHTSDRERFGVSSYETWYSKTRTPFALLDSNGVLAAFAWFGPKPLGRKSLKHLSKEEQEQELNQTEDTWHTLVYRSYHPYRGKGLMTDFIRLAMDTYKTHYPHAKFWAGISMDNEGSIALASKLGFIRREELVDHEKHWLAMTSE